MTAFTSAALQDRIMRDSYPTSNIAKSFRDIADSVAAGGINSTSNIGTANTGVTAVEYGDGYNHTTVLSISVADAITVADNAALADGYLLYTLPAGAVIITDGYLSGAVSVAEDTTNAVAEIGLGTVIGSTAVATLGAVGATSEDISGPAASVTCDGVAEVVAMLSTDVLIATGDAHTVHFNVASTWGDTAGTDLTGDISGTAVLHWKFVA